MRARCAGAVLLTVAGWALAGCGAESPSAETVGEWSAAASTGSADGGRLFRSIHIVCGNGGLAWCTQLVPFPPIGGGDGGR
jgi:hypothetical protein